MEVFVKLILEEYNSSNPNYFVHPIAFAPAYISSLTLHNDRRIPYVSGIDTEQYNGLFDKFKDSKNPNTFAAECTQQVF